MVSTPFVTCVLAIPLLLLWDKYQIEAFRTLGFVIFLNGGGASVFTSREVVIRMEEDPALLFSQALAHTLYRYLTHLCFLPLIGSALQRFLEKRGAKNPFTTDEK